MILTNAEKAIAEIPQDKIKDYQDYWNSIAPKDDHEYFMRWVFSFLSVHTTWSANVFAFNLLKANTDWLDDVTILENKLIDSKVGLYKRRLKGIWAFTKSYWSNPDDWKKKDDESWTQCRDRLQTKCHGIGLAKTAFALEMCYPLANESVCLDTHMLSLYGYTLGKDKHKGMRYNVYTQMENHWVEQCKLRNIPAYIGRALFWDMKQNQKDSRYWSYVLEAPQHNEVKNNQSHSQQEIQPVA